MYLKTEEFKAIEKALKMLPHGKNFERLRQQNKDIIIEAETAMLHCLKRNKRSNERQRIYLSGKRAVDKDYGRGKSKYIPKRLRKEQENG